MENLLATIKPALLYIASADYTGVILFCMIIVFGIMIYRLNKSDSSKFFYDQLFVDKDGTASTSKLAHITALFLSSWGFIHLTLKGALTEWYFLTYMTVWVLQRSYSKWIDLKASEKDKEK